MLGIDELLALEKAVASEFEEHLTEILTRLNRSGNLELFLELAGLRHLLVDVPEYEVYKDATIVVIGQSSVDAGSLEAIAKRLGISKQRLELHLDYKDGKTIDITKYQYDPNYAAILFGPIPHSGVSKEKYSSIISRAEKEPGFPPVKRLGEDKGISKSRFRDALEALLKENIIVTDLKGD